jgi:tetratricopeptide (TPR) repeat protein
MNQKSSVMKIITIIFFSQLCFSVASQELKNMPAINDSTLSISDNDFKELEQKLESEDPTFRFKFISEKDVSFFLAAQKKRPQSFIWIDLIRLHFAGERYNARQLENENEQKILFENALQYLTESLKTLENIKLTDSNDSIKQFYNLYLGSLKEDIAFAAMGAGDYSKAKQLANELLINNDDTLYYNYGNTIHNANTLLGRIALMEDDIKQAKEYLIKSGECPTSPQLSFFGPSYVLAKELLERGERDIVLDYLDLISNIWANPNNSESTNSKMMTVNQRKSEMLKKWKEEIMSGKIPDDPRWK